MLKRTKLSLAVSAAFGAALAGMAPGAGAQAPAAPQTLDRVEITGSNIRRLDSETASPVQIITQEEMVRAGYTTVNEVLRDITANGQGLLSQGFSRAFAGGASGVALRGLGVGATLVLIDGVRMAAYPLSDDAQRPFVDIASIPFSVVERIEVVLDGASAIYGSDAIGGVVNVILKKSFTGTGLVADAGTTTKGGGSTWHASITHGFGNPADKYSGFATFEYRHQDQILLSDRSGELWTNFDWRPQGGNDIRPGAFSPNAGITSPYTRTPYLQNRGQPITNPANYSFLDSNCNFTALRASQCLYEDTWSQIQPETQNLNFLARFAAKFADNWQLTLTGSYFQSESQNIILPRNVPAGSFAGVTAIGLGVTPAIIGAIPAFTVPASYPGNPFGVPANVRAIMPDQTGRTTDFESNAVRLVAQVSGAVAGWDINASAGYTKVETDITYSGTLNATALFNALNDPVNPFRLTGGNSAAVMNAVSPEITNNVWNELNFVQVIASRDLMPLQGGPLGFATGLGYNYRELNQPNSSVYSTGQVTGPGAAYAAGDQGNFWMYAEVNAPVTKELELTAALRYDDYDTYGSQVVPKVGFKYVPIKEVGIRGTWGQGFRAPSINESGESGALFGFNAIRDPILCPVSNADGSPNNTSPANVPAFCNFAPVYLQTSNPNLEAEKSTNWTLGLILEPIPRWVTTIDYYSIELKNQIITASSLSTYDPLDFAVRGIPQSVTFGDGTTGISSVGPIAYSTSPFVNAQKTQVTGLDLASSYRFNLAENGNVTVGVQWSHIFKYDLTLEGTKFELAGTHGPEIVSGNTGNPTDRAQLSLQWNKGPWTVTTIGNYVGKYDLTDPSVGVNTCEDGLNASNGQRFANTAVVEAFCEVGSFTYWSLNVQYQINKQLMVQLSGTNIFNAKPKVDMGSYAGTGLSLTSNQTGAAYNPSLHGPGTIGPFYTVGLTYNF